LTKGKKILLTFILTISAVLTYFTLYVFTTEPGLHYLVVFYDSVGLLILGGVMLLLTQKFKHKLLTLIIAGTALLTSVPILVDKNINENTVTIGLIISSIGLIGHMISIGLLWKWK